MMNAPRNSHEDAFAALICLAGVFLHLFLSGPLLDAFGMHYTGEEGAFYDKIHPGTYLILLSFLSLTVRRGGTLRQLWRITAENPAAMALLALYLLLFAYMSARSGAGGLAFLIDTHIAAVCCAVVLSYAPPRYCALATTCFVLAAIGNSALGVAERLGRFRFFAFDPEWGVLQETYFRASALRGHPLDNAVFTVVALFVALALPYRKRFKAAIILLFIAALMAFGGRVALCVAVLGLIVLGFNTVRRRLMREPFTLLRLFLLIGACLALPAGFAFAVALLAGTPLGERIVAFAGWEESANSRWLAWRIFDYLSHSDMVFGIGAERILDATYRAGLATPLSVIENPWLQMFLQLGLIAFPFWLLGTLLFALSLLRNKNLPLKLAVLAYFLIVSTAISFARKDSTYLLMVSMVVCAGRGFYGEGKAEEGMEATAASA